MSYGRVLSNCGAGMQRLFQHASSSVRKTASNVSSAFKEPMGTPYSKLTQAEKQARDLEMMEPDFPKKKGWW